MELLLQLKCRPRPLYFFSILSRVTTLPLA